MPFCGADTLSIYRPTCHNVVSSGQRCYLHGGLNGNGPALRYRELHAAIVALEAMAANPDRWFDKDMASSAIAELKHVWRTRNAVSLPSGG